MPESQRPFGLHPVHAIILAFPIALFAGALVSDITYLNTAEIQWSNFAAWLITFGMIFGSVALLWAIITFVRRRQTPYRGRALTYLVLLAVMWVAGLVNAFQHSGDAWSSVGPFGLVLSIISAACALAAGWLAYSVPGTEVTR